MHVARGVADGQHVDSTHKSVVNLYDGPVNMERVARCAEHNGGNA
jgi:hypothetical protein